MKTLKILGIVALVVIGGIGAFIGLGVVWVLMAKDVPITDADRGVVLRAADLAEYMVDFDPNPEFETFEKQRFIDRSEELSYAYDSPLEDEPYISVTVSSERQASDAATTYAIQWNVAKTGYGLVDGDITVRENNAFYSAGDQSRFADVLYQGEVAGHLFVARRGNTIYACTITGLYIDDPGVWHELLDARIARLNDH